MIGRLASDRLRLDAVALLARSALVLTGSLVICPAALRLKRAASNVPRRALGRVVGKLAAFGCMVAVACAGPGTAREDAAPVPGGDAARGEAIVASGAYGCASCHAFPELRVPRGVVGPPLDGMGSRAFIAGELPNTPDVLVAFLQDPPALVPRTGMPDVRLGLDDARHVAAYLYTLRSSRAP